MTSLGGTPIELQLPGMDWKSSDKIKCEFEGAIGGSQSAVVVNSSKALCVSPFLQNTHGSIKLEVTVNMEKSYETRLLVSKCVLLIEHCYILKSCSSWNEFRFNYGIKVLLIGERAKRARGNKCK